MRSSGGHGRWSSHHGYGFNGQRFGVGDSLEIGGGTASWRRRLADVVAPTAVVSPTLVAPTAAKSCAPVVGGQMNVIQLSPAWGQM